MTSPNAHTPSTEKDAMLTEVEHQSWVDLSGHDGWEGVDVGGLYARAVEAVAWELIEQTMDTADREPSAETFREAMLTAHRLLGALRTPPGTLTTNQTEGDA